MKSNYKPIGNYIRLVDERNKGLKHTNLLGVSISKKFIPSVANIIGTDMENYKIIRKNQFACSTMQVRRDKKMPVALYLENVPSIISQAYPIFEIVNIEELLPEYLMMWFTRSEFDREACFNAVGGVRGSLEWEDFCNMRLPIQSIEKQKEIVKEYHILVDRIDLNNQLIAKLEETAQAIYKQWFVDFEFPDANGLPYKSSGGKMGESEFGEIPEEWNNGTIQNLATQSMGFAFNGEEYSYLEGITVLRGENVTEKRLRWDTLKKWNNPIDNRIEKCLLQENDIVIGMDGSKVGKNWSIISKYDLPLLLAQRVSCLRAKDSISQLYIYYSMSVLEFYKYVSQVQTGTSVPHISGQQIFEFPILIPSYNVLDKFNSIAKELMNNQIIYKRLNFDLEMLLNLLLSKLSTIEN